MRSLCHMCTCIRSYDRTYTRNSEYDRIVSCVRFACATYMCIYTYIYIQCMYTRTCILPAGIIPTDLGLIVLN